VKILEGREPVSLAGDRQLRRDPRLRRLAGPASVAVPLAGAAAEDPAVGVLVVAPVAHELPAVVRWLADVLGARLATLARLGALGHSERRRRQECLLLPELIAEVMAEVEPLIIRSGLPVTSELGPDLPVVHSDRQKVKQIVLNLLTNALKFTPSGHVKLVTIRRPGDDLVAIAVEDTGIGIAPEDQDRVFEDLRQADSSPPRERGGAGLGLAIRRRLAAMLGGQITLASAPGRGSTFTPTLPRRARRRA
jgi:signal transduction histidine kinase